MESFKGFGPDLFGFFQRTRFERYLAISATALMLLFGAGFTSIAPWDFFLGFKFGFMEGIQGLAYSG